MPTTTTTTTTTLIIITTTRVGGALYDLPACVNFEFIEKSLL